MLVRRMTIADYGEVYRLWRGSGGMGLRPLDDTREGIAKFLERNPHSCFVAEAGRGNSCGGGNGGAGARGIAGVILSGHDGRRGYIYHAAVREDCRGMGAGTALVAAVEDAMKKEGINKIALVAFASNAAGNDFWEKKGYAARGDLVYRNKSLNEKNE
ncbi:MAG: GNAT family N-acetyltransferase [Treponema sp.]|nr:GNAT family N-acetyltransferase [Treponema sp.]